MNRSLTIAERLKDLRVVDKSLTLEQLAEATKISKSTLGKYEQDTIKDMSPFNIAILAKFYGVSTDYLLGLTETKNHPNLEIASLGLNDKAIEVLMAQKFNPRLLSEMISHPDFPLLLVDMEIYVDSIAAMGIQQLNTWLDETRKKVVTQYAPDPHDLHLRTLEKARVDEHEYFTKAIYEDLKGILQDIRTAHAGDESTADSGSAVESLRASFAELTPEEGRKAEQQARIFCRSLGIAFDALSLHQFEVLMEILKLSHHLQIKDNLRGKHLRKK